MKRKTIDCDEKKESKLLDNIKENRLEDFKCCRKVRYCFIYYTHLDKSVLVKQLRVLKNYKK